MLFEREQTILFQGDSVTDCGRVRGDDASLGSGYPLFIASRLTAEHPELKLRFINRGVSGDRSCNLVSRWQEDCIALKPDCVSVLIGINDTWRRYDSSSPTAAQDYADNCRILFSQVKDMGARLIVLEPFLLPFPDDRIAWRNDLDDKITALRTVARELADIYIPLDGIFAAASVKAPMQTFCRDGVHPMPAGHALITDAFIKAIS